MIHLPSQTWKKIWLIIQSVLCALTAAALAAAVIRIYTDGRAVQITDPFYHVFTREKAGEQLMRLLPLIAVTAGWALAGWILGIRGRETGRQASLPMSATEKAAMTKPGRKIRALRILILVLAVILIVLGILNGGLEDVFSKGAVICTECVGLG